MKLYEIANNYQRWLDYLEASGGEMTPEAEAELGQLDEFDLPEKVEGCCKFIRCVETETAAALAERDRLDALIATRKRMVAGLKDYLKFNLERMGKTKVDTDLFVVRIQKNGRPSVDFDGDVAELPDHFRKVTINIEVNKDAALEAWKNDEELPAGLSVRQGNHLRIT
jgi:hypothetical protein